MAVIFIPKKRKFTFHYELIITGTICCVFTWKSIYISLWTNYNLEECSQTEALGQIYISLWTNYNIAQKCNYKFILKFTFHYELIITKLATRSMPFTFTFTFHYELIITDIVGSTVLPVNKFTFHYELIITLYYSALCRQRADIYISLWTNYNSSLSQ